MNKLRLAAFIVLVTIIIIAVFIIFLLSLVNPSKPPTSQAPTIPTIVPPNLPNSKKIDISGIPVNNPYISPTQINAQGDSLMTQASVYELIYLKPFNEFLISITASPFEANRKLAEEAFLKRLGVTEKEACNLKVNITTRASVNPNEAGKKYKLSFCP